MQNPVSISLKARPPEIGLLGEEPVARTKSERGPTGKTCLLSCFSFLAALPIPAGGQHEARNGINMSEDHLFGRREATHRRCPAVSPG